MKNLTTKTEEILESLQRLETNGVQQLDIDLCLQQVRDLYAALLQLHPEEKVSSEIEHFEKPVVIEKSFIEFVQPFEFIAKEPTTVSNESVAAEKTEIGASVNDTVATPIETTVEQVVVDNIEPVKEPEKMAEQLIIASEEQVKAPEKSFDKKDTAKKIVQPSLFNGSVETESKTLGEQLGEKKTSLNEVLGLKAQQQDVVTRLQSKPITDIKAAIGIGDRFLFIRELFDGDNDLYNKTLEYLNGLNDMNEAVDYLKTNFKWNQEHNTVDHFMKIVHRKFNR